MKTLLSIFLSLLLLSACVPTILTGGSATGVQLAHDRRETAAIENDREIEETLSHYFLTNENILDHTHVTAMSFNEKVLLVGQVPDETMKIQIAQKAQTTPHVKKVYNELKIGPVTGLTQRAKDSFITTRVKSAIIANNTIGSFLISVTTENSIVYLMGLVTRAEAEQAVEKARSVKGVNEVVRFFEYVD